MSAFAPDVPAIPACDAAARRGARRAGHEKRDPIRMTIEDDIAFLERVPALAILGRDALRILAIGSESRYVHEGVCVVQRG